ncbi:tyrosine-type recombinase/integrase [Verrucomicrobiota bacterium]
MANLFRRKGSPCWYGRFQHNGNDIVFSTGVPTSGANRAEIRENKKRAEQALVEKQAEARGQVSVEAIFDRLLVALQTVENEDTRTRYCRRFARALSRDTKHKLPLAEVWAAWEKAPKKRDPVPQTLSTYRRYWTQLQVWLAANHPGVEYMHEIDDDMGQAHFGHLWSSGIAAGTYNRTLRILRALFNALERRAGLVVNPFREQNVPIRDNDAESRRCLTTNELTKVCQSATGELRPLLGMGFYLGARLGDACCMPWEEHVTVKGRRVRLGPDLAAGVIRFMPTKTARRKKIVEALMHPVLSALLAEQRAACAEGERCVLPRMANLYRKGAVYVSKLVADHFRANGIETSEAPNGHRKQAVARAGFHSLRHSLVSLCAANAVPVQAIQALVGHGSPLVTDGYTHLTSDEIAQHVNPALPAAIFSNGVHTETP